MNLAHPGTAQKDFTQKSVSVASAAGSQGVRFWTGNTLIYFLSVVLAGSAAAKLSHITPVVTQMAALGFGGGKLIFISVLELASALLFAYPRTRSFGLLMVSAYLGGAISAHVGHDESLLRPAIVLVLFWLATWLRHPQTLWHAN